MPAVIFDLDGTLVDSYAAHFQAWTALAADLGHALQESEFQKQFGRKNEPILEELHGWRGSAIARRVPQMAMLADDEGRTISQHHWPDTFPEMEWGLAIDWLAA